MRFVERPEDLRPLPSLCAGAALGAPFGGSLGTGRRAPASLVGTAKVLLPRKWCRKIVLEEAPTPRRKPVCCSTARTTWMTRIKPTPLQPQPRQ